MHNHDKKNEHTHGHHGSGNSFMLGALVGGALVFLLGTKKGRAILRELSDKGLDAIENVQDLSHLDDLEEEVAAMGEEPSAVVSESQKEISPKVQVKKFFKGVKKK